MLTRISLQSYRCFHALSEPLGDFLLLVGPNGSGKSTLLDALVVLGELTEPRSCAEVFLGSQNGSPPRAQTLQELVHRGRGDHFVLEVDALAPASLEVPPEPAAEVAEGPPRGTRRLLYQLTLALEGHGRLVVDNELMVVLPHEGYDTPGASHPSDQQLLQRGRDGAAVFRSDPYGAGGEAPVREFRFELPPERTALSNLPADRRLFGAALWFRDFLQRGVLLYQPDWRQMRRPCPPGRPPTLLPDGSNLAWLVKRLQDEDGERFKRWEAHVRTGLPELESIRAVVREEDHHAYLRLAYRGGYQVTSSGLSHGTLRLLALTLAGYLEHGPGLVAVEEPEAGLHPRAIETVMQALQPDSGTQFLVSTHSPLVVTQSPLSRILCLRMTDQGAVTATRGTAHPVLRNWRGEASLGTLFAAGVFD